MRAESSVASSLDSEFSCPIETSKLPPPGKPYASNVSYKGFQVNWQQPCYGYDIHHYTVSYQANEPSNNWHILKTADNNSHILFNGTKETLYVFKVAAVTAVGVSSDSEVSDAIETKAIPLGAEICMSLDSISKSNPITYLLPTHCVMKKNGIAKVHVGANTHGMIRSGVHTRCLCHTRTSADIPHKVLMLVGATGAGKTTLINGMANYILGVQWDDDLRFKLIAEPNSHDQTVSQTSCITAYTFYRETDSPLSYTLTVIDTPGFGEIDKDKQIFQQIKELFSIEGIDQLHGIGFVTPAPIRRLTPTLQYEFDTVLSVFGKNVSENIFIMITFADGLKPPVLDIIKAAKVPFQEFFMFNNSAPFASTSANDDCVNNFIGFFQKFSTAKAESLQLSKEVIQVRETLERTTQDFHLSSQHPFLFSVQVYRSFLVSSQPYEMRLQAAACKIIEWIKEIALRPNYPFKVEYIDLIIKAEKREAKPRWLDRVKALKELQRQAEILNMWIEKS